jgi:hypothetical protein
LEDSPTGAKFFYAFRASACGNAVLTGVIYPGKGQLCQALKPIFFQKTGQNGPETAQQSCYQRLTQRFLAQNKPPSPAKPPILPSFLQTNCLGTILFGSIRLPRPDTLLSAHFRA